MSYRKPSGITRNKSEAFQEQRRVLHVKANRFKDVQLTVQMTSLKKPFFTEEADTASTIESVRPIWLQHFQECEGIIRSVQAIRNQMAVSQNRRLTCVKQQQERELEANIFKCAIQATKLIRQCEKLIGVIQQQKQYQTPGYQQVCQHICFRLAFEVQEGTKLIRQQQRAFIEQRKEFQTTSKPSFLEIAADKILDMGEYEEVFEGDDLLNLEERNADIMSVAQSIRQLNEIFKQLSHFVILQGSLLDRIDTNIAISHQVVKEGVQTLVRAQKTQKKTGRCACGIMIALLVAISIVMIILLVHWFNKV